MNLEGFINDPIVQQMIHTLCKIHSDQQLLEFTKYKW